MTIHLHRNFEKQYKRLQKQEKSKFKERVRTLIQDEFHATLNNHALKGVYQGYRSINVTGDLRAVYRHETKEKIIFVAIDTHGNLYG
jgi:addiction module RelE/StbE family toxin